MITLQAPLDSLTSIKKPTLARLKHLDIETVEDLLRHFPTRYDDYSLLKPIAEVSVDELASFEGVVSSTNTARSFQKKLPITNLILRDDAGDEIRAIWFNQPFLAQSFKVGMRIRLSGKVESDKNGLLLKSPAWEVASRQHTHTARLVPVYPETLGITSKFFRWQIEIVFKKNPRIPDPMPAELLEKLHLPTLAHAFQMIHRPESENDYLVARKRFAWDEIFLMQLRALQVKNQWDSEKSCPIPLDAQTQKTFLGTLPFTLTNAQQHAINTIAIDLAQPKPMNRLLNGDVGSGKTIVAATSMLQVASAGFQAVILAPTEVLARQHFESLRTLFTGQPFDVCLLTASYKILGTETVKRETLVAAIRQGIPRIIIATHALLQKDIRFHNLALIIIDEQHRFGVNQRAFLQQSAANINDGLPSVVPHFLTMTATPIPRTLALAFFGNLDVSLLNEMPAKRIPIVTKIAHNNADRAIVYDFIRKEIKKGRQAFVILPLVEVSEKLVDIKAAVAEHARLSKDIFPDLKLGLLHGKVKSKDKEQIMADFKNKKYDILVATSVIEVGIDIPNASVILIEEADRFGLAQLHQFRGRVGRGVHASYCFLLPGTKNTTPQIPTSRNAGQVENTRLSALEKTNNGFELAEADLKLRGPGSLFGTRQSGLSDMAMASLGNIRLVSLARDEATTLLAADPSLAEHPLLAQALTRFDEQIHLE
ncbi:MAG: ATP-dependent DNA helicase RecG [Candidatus Moraniibacteriota bacterium]